ncbi:hypothetical protein [Moraxella veridica]|nr:hypothetical protein [Moraxella catarrhalis]
MRIARSLLSMAIASKLCRVRRILPISPAMLLMTVIISSCIL